MAPILEGEPNLTQVSRIELECLPQNFRTQRIIFEAARDVFDHLQQTWEGTRKLLLAQLVQALEQFMRSHRITISPLLFDQDELRRRLILNPSMSRVLRPVWGAVRQKNAERLEPVFDRDHPIRSAGDMRSWYTSKPCNRTKETHINVCV